MLFSCIDKLANREEAELLVLPFWKGPKKVVPAAKLESLAASIKGPIETKDFSGDRGETALVYLTKGQESRVLLLGLGKENEVSVEGLRQAYCKVVKFCQKKGLSTLNVVLPSITELRHITTEECLTGIAEGIMLTNYCWNQYLTLDEETVLLKKVSLIGITPKIGSSHLHQIEETCKGVFFARDLINGNADDVTPQYLAKMAQEIAKKHANVTVTVLDKKQIEKEKMGLFLAVARGSMRDPVFIVLSFMGNPKSKDHTVIVGKGITYDTGGLNVKPTGSMEDMRADMSGSAMALATLDVAAQLKLKVNITVVVAATENAIGSKSYKPGDVYKSYAGTTVEIGNTDAEGRLTLADALAYTVKNLKPTRMIDFATLTGSIVVALGDNVSGLFCNDESLANDLLAASHATAENLWRMPLHKPYNELLKSDVADLKNIGGKPAGSITAALFLQHFVKDIPWAHIDIAGTAFLDKEGHYLPKNGVGFGVRCMVKFLLSLKNH